MTTLEIQLEDLLEHSISTHGYWLKNNIEIIKNDLNGGIVKYGLNNMKQRISDWQSPYVQALYDKIKANR